MYAEIVNGLVVNIYDSLPENYKNISNFFALSDSEVSDLAWAGHQGAGFYKCNNTEPPNDNNNYEPNYTINHDSRTVNVTWVSTGPKPLEVPQTVTATQIRLWLVSNGISLASVDGAINNISDPLLREQTRVQWEYAPYVERNHPLLESLGSALGLSSQQIDAAFIQASSL